MLLALNPDGASKQPAGSPCQSTSCVAARSGKLGGYVLDFVAAMENCSIARQRCCFQTSFGPHRFRCGRQRFRHCCLRRAAPLVLV